MCLELSSADVIVYNTINGIHLLYRLHIILFTLMVKLLMAETEIK